MKGMWWKFLSVIVIIGVFVFGLLVPLAPGVTSSFPSKAKAGESVDITIEGYNVSYDQGMSAWLKLEKDFYIAAKKVVIENDRKAQFSFDIPLGLPSNDLVVPSTLILNTKNDGFSVLPSAISLVQKTANKEGIAQGWELRSLDNIQERTRMTFPYRNLLQETIRNTYFHVPLWFGLMFIMLASMIYSIRFLSTGNIEHDLKAKSLTSVGVVYGLLGLLTGGIWAMYTWGAFWSFDVKQNLSAVAILFYLAYYVLRSSFDDPELRARVASVYNIFAFVALIPLLFVIPRMVSSMHPGSGGNPAFSSGDLDNTMRMIFYPSVIAWTLFGFWMAQLLSRFEIINWKLRQLE